MADDSMSAMKLLYAVNTVIQATGQENANLPIIAQYLEDGINGLVKINKAYIMRVCRDMPKNSADILHTAYQERGNIL